MKLWEIKAQALRLMFADSDIQFSENEFEERVVYENANTNEKLIRMEDSIRRAIDTYYEINGVPLLTTTKSLSLNGTTIINEIDTSSITNLGYPSRIDINIKDSSNNNIFMKNVIDFEYDQYNNKIIPFEDYTSYADGYTITFTVWYRKDKTNLSYTDIDDMTTDLDTLLIPSEVQRRIPLFIKGELYEEDEPQIAAKSMNDYINFLYTLKRTTRFIQNRIRRAKVFNK